MKVTESQFTVGKTKQSAPYVRGAPLDYSPITRGVSSIANAAVKVAEEQKQKDDNMKRFRATASLVDYNTQVELEQNELRKVAQPDDTQFATKAVDTYINRESEFINTLPPDLQEEFRMRVADTRARVTIGAHEFQDKQLTNYYTNEVDKRAKLAAGKLAENPDELDVWRSDVTRLIEESDMSETNKIALNEKMQTFLETQAYRSSVRKNRLNDAQYSDELSSSVRQGAQELGADPIDLMTIISYETGGKLSTGTRGGAGNRHIGLIQFGPEEAKKYGVYEGQPVGEQMKSVVAYLKDRGYKPGMSFAQLYATINGGNPGALNASDAANGGMPGTVLDKVNSAQMAEHRAKALQVLDGKYTIPDELDNDPRFSLVPYEDRVAARKDTNTEINALMAQMKEERKAAIDAFNNSLYLKLQSGDAGRQDIEDAINAGQLKDYEARQKAYKIVEDREKETEDKVNFLSRIATGQMLDPTDADNKKNMNLLFGKEGELALSQRDEQYVTNRLGNLFQQTGMLPPDAVGLLRTLATSADGRQVLFANEALNTLEELNPQAYALQVPEDARKRADRFEALQGVYPDQKELINILRGSTDPAQRRVQEELRVSATKDLTKAEPPVLFDSVRDAFDAEVPAGNKGIAMEKEWRQLVVENYAATGGISYEIANDLAIKQLKRVWGVSNLNGTATMMRFPPETFPQWPAIGDSHEWMDKQIRGELGLTEDETYTLIPDRQTENEVNRGGLPSYMVQVVKDGVIRQVMGDDGLPYRHTFVFSGKDKEAYDLETQIKHKTYEYQYHSQYDAQVLGSPVLREIPPEITAKKEQLAKEIEELKAKRDGVGLEAATQYETPARKRLKELEAQYAPINDALMNWVDPVEEFPQIKEWEQLHDEIKKLQPVADQELKSLRERRGN